MSERCSSQSARSGQQCRLRTRGLCRPSGNCESEPVCWIHLRAKTGLRVKQSTIEGAGRGLFVERNIPRGANIGEYTGKTVSSGSRHKDYDMLLSGGRKIDGSDPLKSSVMRYANHKPFAQANAMIVDRDRGSRTNGFVRKAQSCEKRNQGRSAAS